MNMATRIYGWLVGLFLAAGFAVVTAATVVVVLKTIKGMLA